jgi:regulator of cell morphogenesis and NO signaling
MQITSTMKLADVINMNFMLLPVISRFDIKLGCGEKTVNDVCTENNIDTLFFLEIINSFNDKHYFPEKDLQDFPLDLIIDYLRKSHEHYLMIRLPYLDDLVGKFLEESFAGDKKIAGIIIRFFNNYKSEIQNHLQREESRTFPYVTAVEKTFLSGHEPDKKTRAVLKSYSMDIFTRQHDNIEDKLYDLKNLIIKYVPPGKDLNLTNTIIMELFRLEADLNDHARLEDKVLVPKVRYMEKWIHEHYFRKTARAK